MGIWAICITGSVIKAKVQVFQRRQSFSDEWRCQKAFDIQLYGEFRAEIWSLIWLNFLWKKRLPSLFFRYRKISWGIGHTYDCRMRCLAAALLYLLFSGHVLPQAIHSQLTKALQLSRFLMLLLRANVFDLYFVQCSVLALFHHHQLNPLQTPSKPQRVLTQQNFCGWTVLCTRSASLALYSSFLFPSVERSGEVDSSWAISEESSRVSAGVTGTKWQLWSKNTQSVVIDNKRIVTESVNSFGMWLNNSSKWKQMIISFSTVGAEGNEWTFTASVLRSHTELEAAFGQLRFDFITSVRRSLVSRLVHWQLIDLQHLIC